MSVTSRPARTPSRRRRGRPGVLLAAALGVPLLVAPATAQPGESPSDDASAAESPTAGPAAQSPAGETPSDRAAVDGPADAVADPPSGPVPDGPASPVQLVTLTDQAGEPTATARTGVADAGRSTARALPTAVAPNPDDLAVAAAQRDGTAVVLTEEIDTDGFLLAAVTWAAGESVADDARIWVRARAGGEWSSWGDLDPETPREDGLPGGTEPFITTEADGVQVQVDPGSGDLPADLTLTLVPGDVDGVTELLPDGPGSRELVVDPPSGAATAGGTGRTDGADGADGSDRAAFDFGPRAPGPHPTADGARPRAAAGTAPATRPEIISRWTWGATMDWFFWDPEYVDLRAAVVHHTAGSNTYTQTEAPGVVRSIYHYHAQVRGWGDIGYNFLVDRWGRIYEGRYGSLWSPAEQMPVGAHAAPQNRHTVGVSIMGDFSYGPAPQAAMDAVRDVIAWRFEIADVDVDAPTGMYSLGTSFTPAGAPLPAIMGHRDVANVTRTICPGPYVAAALPGMMAEIRQMTGNEFFLSNTWSTRADVEFGFGERGLEVLVGDWDGDGRDTVGVRSGNRIELTNGHSAGTDVVLSYGRPGDELLVGDWDRDGRDTLGVRRGNVIYLRNDLVSGAAHVEFTYGRVGDVLLVGDFSGNGRDTFAVRRGNTYYLSHSHASGPADIVLDYGRAADEVVVGDWDGNGTDTFTVRRGAQYFMRNSLTSGVADRTVIFGRVDDRVVAGDWDGNGTDTLGVVR